jgi:glycosyltransferase involved in cell wall biosynthesis
MIQPNIESVERQAELLSLPVAHPVIEKTGRVSHDGEIDILYVGFVLGHGGDAVQMVDLAAEIGRRGLRVRIIVPEIPTTLVAERRAQTLGVDLVRTPLIRADAHNARQNLVHLLRMFRDNRARLYHLHTGDVCLPRLALLAMGLLDVRPVVVTTHSPYSTLSRGDARARHWAHAAARQLERVVCPSAHSRSLQIDYGIPADKVMTIQNSVDVTYYASGRAEEAYRTLRLDPGGRLLVFTSRLDDQKRPDDAVRVFARLAPEFPDLHLVMAGCGEAEERVRALAAELPVADRIHFPGFQPNVPDWLAAAAVWLFPTESENFSLALLEAMSAGCAIVSTLCQGNDEILVDGENALTARVGDVEAMTTACRRILTDRQLAARLSAGARATVSEYSLANMVDRYAACYNECLGVNLPQPG